MKFLLEPPFKSKVHGINNFVLNCLKNVNVYIILLLIVELPIIFLFIDLKIYTEEIKLFFSIQ